MFVSVHKSTQDCFRNAEDEIQGGFWDINGLKKVDFRRVPVVFWRTVSESFQGAFYGLF